MKIKNKIRDKLRQWLFSAVDKFLENYVSIEDLAVGDANVFRVSE